MISIKNVTKIIDKQEVLKEINITFEKNKTYAIVGRNGSGKSMLLRLICGLIKPTDGSVEINSNDASFGVLIEKPKFLGDLTGFENLEVISDINKKIGEKEINDILKKVNLYEEKNKKYKKYSLGMKQKLGIAQAIMENPDIILLDEPFNGLDNKSVHSVRNLLLELKKKGKLIVIATHNKEDIEILCDEVYEMDNGIITK